MPDYSDHSVNLSELKKSQDADKDMRKHAREAHLFVDKRDGQWETNVVEKNFAGRPKYTIDKASPIIKQISGQMKKSDFGIKITPLSGDASKDNAEVIGGIVRNIQALSNASNVYNAAGKGMVTSGLDGWMIKQDYVGDDSFDQDFIIEQVPNFLDSVWFSVDSIKQDKSDAKVGWRLSTLTKEAYNEEYPEGSGIGVSDNRQSSDYWQKAEKLTIGQVYYKKIKKRELVMMSNGMTYEVNEDFDRVVDDLAAIGVTETRRRTREDSIVYTRKFDGEAWLNDEQETVFSFIPLIPTYGNFKIAEEGKTIYYGAIEKILDPCRVANYAYSRKAEELALQAKDKFMATPEQYKGYEREWETMHTNADPLLPYNHVGETPPPYKIGSSQPNAGLIELEQSSAANINSSAGMFDANMGDNPGLQSGVAIEQLKDTGDIGTIDYYESQEIAICHTARIIVDALPRLYDTEKTVRILSEDGSYDMQTINQRVLDQQTGEVVELNNLSAGKYDVACEVGKTFKSRQQETVAAFTEIAQVMPEIMQVGGDVLAKNVTAPGMDAIHERLRNINIQNGVIPESQYKEEELQKLQEQEALAQQQEQEPDPNMLFAQAEMGKAEAANMEAQVKLMNAQTAQAKVQLESQDKLTDNQVKVMSIERQANSDAIKAEQNQQQLDLNAFLAQQEQQNLAIQTLLAQQSQVLSDNKIMAETLKLIREAGGVDTFVGPGITKSFINQAEELNESIVESSDTNLTQR